MANPNVLIADAAGLQTQPNELTLAPGSLTVAENVEITRDGVIEVARGFEDFSDNLPDFTPEQLLVVGDTAYLHLDNGLWYHDGTRWLRKAGVLGARPPAPNDWVILNGVLYCAAHTIVIAIDLSTGKQSVIAGRYGVSASTDGTGDAARFVDPAGITSDGTNLYVADSGHTIRKLSPPLTAGAAVVTTIAGSGGSSGSTDGTGASARFNSPKGITFDGTNLYVCDFSNHTIRCISPPLTAGAAVVTTIAGTAGANGSSDGTGAAARFKNPADIAFDGISLYVCDDLNHTIRKLDPPLTAGAAIVTTIAGTAGANGTSDGTGAAAGFDHPQGIASDGTNLYVCDTSNYTIRKLSPPLTAGAAIVSTIAGAAGSVGFSDGIGTDARFGGPGGIFFDANGDAYVCDGSVVIRKIYIDSAYVTTISGVSSATSFGPGASAADGIVLGPS